MPESLHFLDALIKNSKLTKAAEIVDSLFINCSNSNFIKVSSELAKIDDVFNTTIDVEQEIIKASNDFRTIFKEAALKEGYSEDYINGIFDTSEKLIKKSFELPMEGIGDAANGLWTAAKNVFKTPGAATNTAVQAEPAVANGMNIIHGSSPNIAGETTAPTVQTSTNPSTEAAPGMLRNIWNKLTLKGNTPNLWNGVGWKGPMAGATAGGGLDLLTGLPGVGTAAGAVAGALPGMGARRMLLGGLGAGAAYEGGKALINSGAPQAAASGIGSGISTAIQGSNPSSDAIPGIGNGLTGTIGGYILATLLARQMGLSGLPGTALGLLGAYGGYKYMPQLLAKLRSGMNNGNFTPKFPQYNTNYGSPSPGPAFNGDIYGYGNYR